MSQLIASRYRPLSPSEGAPAVGRLLLVEDSLSGRRLGLRIVAAPEDALGHVRLTLRAAALSHLAHGGLQAVYEPGQLADGHLFVAVAAPRGRQVAELIPLPPDRVPLVFLRLCQALRILHARGFAHGDLSADRLALVDDFQPLLAHGPRLGLDASVADDLRQLGRLFYFLLAGREPAPGSLLPGALRANVPPYQDALVQRLMAGELGSIDDALMLLPVSAEERAAPALGAAPLLGRDAELAALHRAWEGVAARQGAGLLSLTGEAGLGKTRLIEEAIPGWQLAGAKVLIAHAVPAGGPYRPWIALLRQALPFARRACPGVYAATAPVLQALLHQPEVEAAPALEPRQEKLRLQSAMAELFAALAGCGGGLVLVLDNWSLADDLSRELLGFVARQALDQPLLLVLVGDEAPAAPGLDAERVTLGPLTAEVAAALARSLLGGRAIAPAVAEAAAGPSEGNPRLLTELLGYLLEARQLRLDDAGWHLEGALAVAPRAIEDLYRARLAQLGPDAGGVAGWCAVLGHFGELELLQALWDGAPEALAAGLDALRAQGILHVGAVDYRFAQPGWAVAALEGLSPGELSRRHDAIAGRLEQLASEGRGAADGLQRLANHALAGSNRSRAVAAALASGRANLALYATSEALRFLEAGLAHWAAAGGPGGSERESELPLRRLLGDVKRIVGAYDEGVAHYERACALAEQAGDRAALGHMLTSAGKCRQMANRYAEATAYYERALGVYATVDDRHGRLRALTSLARTAFVQGQMADAERMYQQALAEAEAEGAQVALGESLGALGLLVVSNHPARIAEGVALLQRSIAIRQAMGDKIGLTDSCSLLGNAYLTLGQLVAAREAFTRTQRLCFETGNADEEIFALINLAIVALEMGEFTRLLELALSAKGRAIASGSRFCQALALALEGLGLAHTGALRDVQARMDHALALARELENKYLEVNILVFVVEAYLLFGRLTEAVDLAQACEALMNALGYLDYEARLLVFRGEVHGRLGERAEARALLLRALERAQASETAAGQARALRTLAWLEVQEKNWLEARDAARQALALGQAIGAHHLVGEVHWLLGEIALAAGHASAANRELQTALAFGERTGSPHLQGLALFCLARTAEDDLQTREYLFQARDLLGAQLEQLDEATREDYLALAERWRVDRGELVFAEKAHQKMGPTPLTTEGRAYFERLLAFAAFAEGLHRQSAGAPSIDAALQPLIDLMESQRACVLLESEGGRRVLHAGRGEHGEPSEADRTVLEALAGAPGVYYQPYASDDDRFAGLYPDVPASLLAVGFERGVALVVRHGLPFSPREAQIMALVGHQWAIALENAAGRPVRS